MKTKTLICSLAGSLCLAVLMLMSHAFAGPVDPVTSPSRPGAMCGLMARCTPKGQGVCTACTSCLSCGWCKAGGKCTVCD